MKRLFIGGFAALSLAALATPANANLRFEYRNTRHISLVRTARHRNFSFTSYAVSLPPATYPNYIHYRGPVPWDGLNAYPRAAYAAPAAGARPSAVVPAPAAKPAAPAFKAPQPKLSGTPRGVMQAGYSSYGQTNNAAPNYGAGHPYYGAGYLYYGAGYNYGYGPNYSYAQAPNYWD